MSRRIACRGEIDTVLMIRREQMMLFEEAQRHWFALEMVDHLHRYAPAHAARIGDHASYQLSLRGLDKAGQYGFSCRGPVRLYIELMVLLGTHFDTDPQYPWATRILNGRRELGEMQRADLLQQEAGRFYDSVLGSDYQYEHAAIRRLRAEQFADVPDWHASPFSEILIRLRTIYPEKATYVGQAALEALAAHARLLACKYSLTTSAGAALMTGMVFAFGHRCDIDPQFPWIAQCLARSDAHGSLQRLDRLRHDFLNYLRTGSTPEGD
jgi:hypothetical protein